MHVHMSLVDCFITTSGVPPGGVFPISEHWAKKSMQSKGGRITALEPSSGHFSGSSEKRLCEDQCFQIGPVILRCQLLLLSTLTSSALPQTINGLTTIADAGHIFATQASTMQDTHFINAGGAFNRGCCTSGCHRSRQILLPPLLWGTLP